MKEIFRNILTIILLIVLTISIMCIYIHWLMNPELTQMQNIVECKHWLIVSIIDSVALAFILNDVDKKF